MTRPLNLYCTTRVLLRLYKLGIIGTSAQACFCMSSMIRGNFSMNVLIPRVESSGRRFSIQLLHSLQKAYNLGSNWGNWRKNLILHYFDANRSFWCIQNTDEHKVISSAIPLLTNQTNQTKDPENLSDFETRVLSSQSVQQSHAEKNTGHNIL